MALPNRAHNESEVGGKFQNLFNSIAKDDARKSKIYLNGLKLDITREQRTFDSMKKRLRTSHRNDPYQQKRVNVKSNTGKTIVATKREAGSIQDETEETVEKLRQELEKKDNEIEELDQEILDKDNEIAGKIEQIVKMQNEIIEKRKVMAAKQQELLPYQQSTPPKSHIFKP